MLQSEAVAREIFKADFVFYLESGEMAGKSSGTIAEDYGKLFATARKRPLNFAMMIGKDGIVLEADPRKNTDILRKLAKQNGGGSRGAVGTMTVSGKLVELHVETDDVPGNLPDLAKKHFAAMGHMYRFEYVIPEDAEAPDAAQDNSERSDQKVVETDDGGDSEDVPEEDEEVLGADLKSLMADLIKRPHNFAWLVGEAGLVLKAHKRKSAEILVKQARSDGGGARGGWGVMERQGKILILNCVEDPPGSLARKARIQLKEQGLNIKVVLRGPSGEITDEEEGESAAPAAKSNDEKKLAAIKKMQTEALEAGDAVKAAKLQVMMDRLAPSAPPTPGELEAGPSAAGEDDGKAAPSPSAAPEGFGGEPDPTASPEKLKKKAKPAGQDREQENEGESRKVLAIPRAVPVDRVMDNLEFSNHVDVFNGKTLAEAQEENKNPEYRVHPLDFEVTEKHVTKGFVIVNFIVSGSVAPSDEELGDMNLSFTELSEAQQKAINAHADEMFWKMTGYKPGEKLDPKDPNFEVMAKAWMQIRAGVISDGQKVDVIPDRLRAFLKFDENGVPVTPADFKRLLELADKLEHLSDAELADYWNRTNSRTEDVNAFADSVERYLEQVKAHQDATRERADAQDKLVAMEDLFTTHQLAKQSYLPTNDEFGVTDQSAIEINAKIRAARDAMPALLAQHGYKSVKEFEADKTRYHQAFEVEAVALANEAMDHRSHDLYVFEQEVVTDENMSGMMESLDGIAAKRDELSSSLLYRTGGNFGPGATDWTKVRQELRPLIEAAIAKDKNLQRLIQLRRDEDPKFTLDDDMIDLLSTCETAAELKGKITGMLSERREGMSKMREVLAEDPEKVWSLDMVMAQTRAEGMVEENSIHDMVLDEHRAEMTKWDFLKNLALGGAAIVAGLVSGGTGTVAVLGAAAAVGIGAYEGWSAYQTYAEEDAAHLAGLSSTDPSFAWVVLALATIPLDVLGVKSAVKATKLARGARIAAMMEPTETVGKAVRNFEKAQQTLDSVEDTSAIIAKLENDLAQANEKVRKAIVRYAKAELEANQAFAKALRSGGKAYAAIDPVLSPIAIMASRFAYPTFLWLRKGVVGLEQFLATRHAIALVGKLDDLKKMQGALPRVKEAYALAKTEAGNVAKAARGLDMTDLDLDSAAAYWAKHPEMSSENLIDKLPLFKQARDNLGPLEDLAETGSDAARAAYRAQLVEAERVANQFQRHGLSDLDIEAAMEFRARNPDMPLDEYIDHLPLFKSQPDDIVPLTGRKAGVARETNPVKASGPVHNPVGASGKKASVKAPRSVMDKETEELLKGLGPENLDHDIAGTGGIEKIKCRRDPADPTVIETEIEGEILPGRLQRDPKKKLKPGQSYAPNLNSQSGAQEAIKKLGFAEPEEWQRLHLWGPGFGDEAAAGMHLGPREVNLEWQNSGVEDLIRELGRQVAPHRGKGFKLKLKAKSRPWGRPTPKGFETATGEPILKEASYEIILETPTGTKTARVDITIQTDPADINLGKDPGVHIGFNETSFRELFSALPE